MGIYEADCILLRATPDFELRAYNAHLNADQSYLEDDEHQLAQDEADVIRQVGISELKRNVEDYRDLS